HHLCLRVRRDCLRLRVCTRLGGSGSGRRHRRQCDRHRQRYGADHRAVRHIANPFLNFHFGETEVGTPKRTMLRRLRLRALLSSSGVLLDLFASTMLRSVSDSDPAWRADASVSAWPCVSWTIAVLPTTTRWPSFSCTSWSIASTRTSLRIVALTCDSTPEAFSASRSRRDRITSTRSFGRMKPPAPLSAEISVE